VNIDEVFSDTKQVLEQSTPTSGIPDNREGFFVLVLNS
jgi:hypothetical protein